MAQAKNYIVTLCYGYERVFYEWAYALLCLSRIYDAHWPENTEIWIYTDKPEWFSRFRDCPLPLHFRKLDEQTLQAWRGKTGFVHRIKIEALKDLIKDKTGNILYADTDSVFMHGIDKMLADIGAGRLYMHTMEGIVQNEGTPLLKKLNKYLRNKNSTIAGKPLWELAMWNAGVIGFNTQHSDLLDKTLALTDEIYPEFPKHIVEQYAFSVCFQREEDIKAAAPYIFHYWKLKEANSLLSSFYDHFGNVGWAELTRVSALIQMHVLMQEKADFLYNRNMIESLVNKQWRPVKPDWAQLLKQL